MRRSATTLQGRLRERLSAGAASGPGRPETPLGELGADGEPRWCRRDELAGRLAIRCRALASYGVGAGDVCVIALPSDLECAEIVLATFLLGAAPLLVAPPVVRGTGEDLLTVLRSVVRRTRPKLAVLDPTVDWRLGRRSGLTVLDAVPSTGSISAGAGLPELARSAPRDLAGLQLTSGTTGRPRICRWSHRGMLAALDGMAAAMELDGDDVVLCWTPLYHDMGLVNNLLLSVAHGIPLVLMSPHLFVKRPGLWLRGLDRCGATITWSPNFGYALAAERATERDLAGVRLDRVRAFYNAAERIHAPTLRGFESRFSALGVRRQALLANFGCAENVGGATFDVPGGGWRSETVDAEALERRGRAAVVTSDFAGRTVEVVAVGRPAPGCGLEVLDRNGRPLAEGRVGELALRSASRMLGYHRDRKATRRALVGDLLRTGDLGYRRGDLVYWVGRRSERINVAGRKLDPSDFERLLFPLRELRAGCMAVFGVPSDRQGTEEVVVVAEVRDPASCDAPALRATIRAGAMRELGVAVAEVLLVAPGTLVKTSSGKRRHRGVKRSYLDGRLGGSSIGSGSSSSRQG